MILGCIVMGLDNVVLGHKYDFDFKYYDYIYYFMFKF